MNAIKNSVRLIGHVGMNPEVKSLKGNKKVVNLSLATSETYKNEKGEKVSETQWHNLVAWGKTAELIELYVLKGSEIAIEGKLTSRSYEAKDGSKRYVTEIVINDLLLLNKKSA
jgi:single-strand DNA-binding protein